MTKKQYDEIMTILAKYTCDENNCRYCKSTCINNLLSKIKADIRALKKEKKSKDYESENFN